MRRLTNSQKASILAVVNATLGIALAFGAPLTVGQTGALVALLNALLGGATVATRKRSPAHVENAKIPAA